LIALLHHDDVAAIQKGFASAEGQAAIADVPTFATVRVAAAKSKHRRGSRSGVFYF
jgi:hypothetical protein